MKKATKRYLTVFLLIATCIAMLIAMGMATKRKVFASADTESYSIAEPYSVADPDTDAKQTGLGLGINVVKAKRVNEFVTGHTILDINKIGEMPTGSVDLEVSSPATCSTTSIETLINSFQLRFDLGGQASAFLGSLKAHLQGTSSLNFSEQTYKYYNLREHKIPLYSRFLINHGEASTYANYFSDGFLDALAELASDKDYVKFFDNYGTHIVGSANFGGKLTASYSLASNKIELSEELSEIIQKQVDFTALSEDVKANLIEEINAYLSKKYVATDLNTVFSVEVLGGQKFACDDIKNFSEGYSNWVNSFNGNDYKPVIIDYENGLVPLWKILPEPYNTTLSAEMEKALNTYYNNNYNSIIKEFEPGNTVDFAGGFGTEEDPYLIANVQHLKNIESVDMSAHYKLKNDINITEDKWEPIGGLYMKNPFNGTLDGNGKKISNLRRTADIKTSDYRYYFGLFGYIGKDGTVKDLTLNNVYIHVTGPTPGYASTRIFIGAVAGILKGTVKNVVVKGECFYDVCTQGTAHVGGIAGCAYTGAKIYNCTNNADITSARYSSSAGGILGYSAGATIQGCTNTGSILSKCTGWGGYAGAGGIVGYKYKGKNGQDITNITSCTNSGTYTCKDYSGGIGTSKHGEGPTFGREVSDFYSTL